MVGCGRWARAQAPAERAAEQLELVGGDHLHAQHRRPHDRRRHAVGVLDDVVLGERGHALDERAVGERHEVVGERVGAEALQQPNDVERVAAHLARVACSPDALADDQLHREQRRRAPPRRSQRPARHRARGGTADPGAGLDRRCARPRIAPRRHPAL